MDTYRPLLLLGAFLLVYAIGIGPALHLVSPSARNRLACAFLLAPAVGLVFLTILLAPLVYSDHPIATIAWPVVGFAFAVSAILLVLAVRKNYREYQQSLNKRSIIVISLAFIGVFLVLILPILLGIEYSFWQGDPWDASNYMLIGWAAKNLTWSYLGDVSKYSTIIQINPALSAVMYGLETHGRSVFFFSVAWMSTIFGAPIYLVYFPAKILNLLIAFFAALAVCKRLGLKPWHDVAVASLVAISFWASYVVDVDAGGQLNAIPLSLLFLFAWLQCEIDSPEKLLSRQRLFLGFSLAGLIYAYPEMLPPLAVSILIYYVLRLIQKPGLARVKAILQNVEACVVAALLVLPQLQVLFRFLLGQIKVYGTPLATVDAKTYYFPWLFNSQMATGGLWGLHFYDGLLGTIPSTLFMTVLGGAMSLIAVMFIVSSLRREARLEYKMLAALVIGFWGLGIVFLLLQQEWLSGKAFGMAYPFVIVALGVFAITNATSTASKRLNRGSLAILPYFFFLIWMATQFSLPAIRARAILSNKPQFAEYVPIKASGFSAIFPAIDAVKTYKVQLLATDFRDLDIFLPPSWTLMLSDIVSQFPLQGLPLLYSGDPAYWANSDKLPDALLVSGQDDYMFTLGWGNRCSLTKASCYIG